MKGRGAQGALDFTASPKPSGSRSRIQLTDEQRLDWLRLIRSDNIGPRTFRGLVNRFGGAAAALDALPKLIRETPGARKIRIADRDACLREIDATHRLGAQFVASGEGLYPTSLNSIDSAPPLIVVKGDVETLSRAMVAMVGSRNASAAGLTLTERLVRDFARADYVVVSGLARGIDHQAHRASLTTGTVAVLAGGLDRIYPSEHRALAESICEHGALVSEMPLGWEPRGRDFPRRNRIVSGLALATVVVEAARRSGSLITARFAAEQGREVFAVPGSPLDPRAEGTNDLLRDGATLCASARDVLDVLNLMRERGQSVFTAAEDRAGWTPAEPLWDEADLFEGQTPATMAGMELDEPPTPPIAGASAPPAGEAVDTAETIAGLLGSAPVALDDLVRASGMSAADVQVAVFDLEMAGRIERHGGGLISLTPTDRAAG